VLLLGLKTGWTLAEIKALPLSEFSYYLKQLTTNTDGSQ
jgi:hypothetical protein